MSYGAYKDSLKKKKKKKKKKTHKREVTRKVRKGEQSCLYATRRLDLIHIAIKFHLVIFFSKRAYKT